MADAEMAENLLDGWSSMELALKFSDSSAVEVQLQAFCNDCSSHNQLNFAARKTFIAVLTLIFERFDNEVQKRAVYIVKQAMSAKNATPAVRMAYMQLLLTVPSPHLAAHSGAIVPILAQAIVRANQQRDQPLAVKEGLHAAYLLLKLMLTSQVENDKQSVLWSAVDEQLFFSEKFLSTCDDETVCCLMLFCAMLMAKFADRLNEKALSGVHRAIVVCITTPKYATRSKCCPLMKKILMGVGTYEPVQSLLAEFNKFLESAKFTAAAANDEVISGLSLSEGLLAICLDTPLLERDARNLLRDLLIPAHHPVIYKASPDLWLQVLRRFFDESPANFLRNSGDDIRELLVLNYKPTLSYENALAQVAALAPDVVLPTLVSHVTGKLDDPEITKVTKDEYFTYLTPEGELYDKSVMPGSDENDILNNMNMKRESKVYSFKEQQEELQLRRELYEKRKREGKIKEPKLTPKQEEAIKAKFAKENAIRQKLTEMNSSVTCVVSMIKAAARGNGFHLSFHFKDLLPSILRDLASPLAAPIMCELFVELRNAVEILGDPVLNEVVACVTLGQLEPQCALGPAWEDEELSKSVRLFLDLLHSHTVKGKLLLSAPAFCYVFNFVKKTLLTCCKDDFPMARQGLEIMQEHAKQRGDSTNPEDVRHPRLMPRKQMFDLLIELIKLTNTTSRDVESHAVATLLDVAKSSSGARGTALATSDEIETLTEALRNPIGAVRNAALHGLMVIRKAFTSHVADPAKLVNLTSEIFSAMYDVCDENKKLANELWVAAGFTANPDVPGNRDRRRKFSKCCITFSKVPSVLLDKEKARDYVKSKVGVYERLCVRKKGKKLIVKYATTKSAKEAMKMARKESRELNFIVKKSTLEEKKKYFEE